jgi:hypothetical protein
MSHFIGDPTVKGLLKSVPPGISYYVDKKLGGIGLFRSRDGLLSPEQIGYYTRVATTRGELAPCMDDPSLSQGEKIENIYNLVDKQCVATEWVLDKDWGNPPDMDTLLDTYLKSNCADISFKNFKTGCVSDLKPTKINGENVKRSRYIGLKSPARNSAFRSILRPYPEMLLSNFPWSQAQLCVYSQTPEFNAGQWMEWDDLVFLYGTGTTMPLD